MERFRLEEMQRRKLDQYVRLMEVSDLTRQLADAVTRRDQVSVNMLLSMREEPVRQLAEMEERIQAHLLELPEEEAIRLSEILRGASPEKEEEAPLCEQVALYRRSLAAVQEMDRELSIQLGGRHSFYNKFRDDRKIAE